MQIAFGAQGFDKEQGSTHFLFRQDCVAGQLSSEAQPGSNMGSSSVDNSIDYYLQGNIREG